MRALAFFVVAGPTGCQAVPRACSRSPRSWKRSAKSRQEKSLSRWGLDQTARPGLRTHTLCRTRAASLARAAATPPHKRRAGPLSEAAAVVTRLFRARRWRRSTARTRRGKGATWGGSARTRWSRSLQKRPSSCRCGPRARRHGARDRRAAVSRWRPRPPVAHSACAPAAGARLDPARGLGRAWSSRFPQKPAVGPPRLTLHPHPCAAGPPLSQVGEMTHEPVKTQFGYHLILCEGRKA